MVNKYSSFSGSALLSALFIMTLVAIAATAVATYLQLSIYRTQLAIHSDKAYLASQWVTFWNMDYLTKAKLNYRGALVARFPDKLSHSYPSVTLTGQLYDLQAQFNLNNLDDPAYRIVFYRLLKNLIPDRSQAKQVTLATLSWIKNYQVGQSDLELATYYAKQHPPYFESQQPMMSISEWRLVKGVSADIYQSVTPFLTALPEITTINICSTSTSILNALATNTNQTLINSLLVKCAQERIDFNKMLPLLNQLGINQDTVSLESQYFLSIAKVAMADFSLTSYAILKRNKDGHGKVKVFLINEYLNTL